MLKALQLTPSWEAGRQLRFLLVGQEKNKGRERDLDWLETQDGFPFSRRIVGVAGSRSDTRSPETRSICNL